MIKGRDLKKLFSNEKQFSDEAAAAGAIIAGGAAAYGADKLYDYGKNKYQSYIDKSRPEKLDYSKIKFGLGDIVSAERHGGAYSHYGVVTGFDKSGKPIITNYVNEGPLDPRAAKVTESGLEEFAKNSKVHVEKSSGKYSPQQIAKRAKNALKKGNGKYSILNNNCEHFARDIANGTHTSTQVTKVGAKIKGKLNHVGKMILKRFAVPATTLIKDQVNHLISTNGFKMRKHLTKELGGLSHFNKYQTSYLTGGGSVVGGLSGGMIADRKAKKDAKRYGLKKGTLEYDDFIRRRRREGAIIGAGVGAGAGFGSSKGIDFVRGKVIADKKRAAGSDLGKDYLGLGKTFRGVKSEKDVDNVIANWKELGSYGKGVAKAIF